ncbi:MAG: septum formation initiator family protein [Candidatus Competibacteraceae bacterium]
MQILVAALIAVLVFLQYLLWIAEDGVRQTHALQIAVQAQQENNAALTERNSALAAEVEDLKRGLMAIERARSEMGMIRKDRAFLACSNHHRRQCRVHPDPQPIPSLRATALSEPPKPLRSPATPSLAAPRRGC